MPKFPTTIYVRWEPCAHQDPCLAASKSPEGEDGEQVAIYTLQEVKTQRVRESLE